MRRGYRKKVKRKIRAGIALWILGVLTSVVVVFFASFWITSFVLQSGKEPYIPEQSDVATPPADTQTQDAEPSNNQTGESAATTTNSAPSKTEAPKAASPSEKPEAKPTETAKPKPETEKENAETPAAEEKPSAEPSVAPEKPVTTPEPTETPKPSQAPAKPAIEIVSPNAG